MNIRHALYQKVRANIPQSMKAIIKSMIMYLFDIGKKQYFGQFGEDAVLQGYFAKKAWKRNKSQLLSFLGPKIEKGFYVDVGAYNPKRHSNTYWFYKQSWRGINIDATPGSMKPFKLIRRHDVNIEAAISNQEEELVFYSWGKPSVMNTLSPEMALKWKKETGIAPTEYRIKTMRLESILDKNLPKDQKISFLSIDAEGHDIEVLKSNNWDKYRPEIIIVEDHKDRIEQIVNSEITSYLKSVRYRLDSWIKPSIIYKNEDI